MRIALAVLLVALCRPATVEAQAVARTVTYGYAHCATPEALIETELVLRTSGPLAFVAFIRQPGSLCTLSDGTIRATVFPAGPNGGPLMWEDQEIVCLESPAWSGCRFSFKRSVE